MEVNDYRMVLPRRVEHEITEEDYGKFIISPLERGYGNTLGNALKRVLLSAIPGAAVTAVRVNDGLELFEKIPGVRENVAQLVLQVKQINPAVAGNKGERIVLTLDHHGSGTVYAHDILCPPNVRILNPDLYLFTANAADAHVTLSFIIEQDEGFRTVDETDELEDGYLAVDANFSPVRRVLFDVDSARVRQRTNYDKLVMEIWTDSTISPQEALSKSAIELIRYLQVFDPESAGILENPQNFLPPEPEPEPEANPMYDVPIEVLDLSTRVFNSLRRTGITSVGDVVDMLERGEDAMLAIRNFGQTSLDELKEKLIENGYLSEDDDDGDDD